MINSRVILLALAFAAPISVFAQAPAAPWPHEGSDLKPDAGIVWGKLDNGFRYAILPNAEPPKRVSLRLYVDAGSLMEEDSQQGLAHFLEHMAFNGTTHFKASEMKAYFERLGMSFGGDTNAHTSFKETVYQLELPEGTETYLADGLKLFRDYAGGMLLAQEEIDKERGVILSEKLARDDVNFRTMVEGFKFSLPEALIPRRLPIGQEEVIKNAPRERFTAFYHKWYTPDRITLVVVGAVKSAEMEPRIKKAFGDLKPGQRVGDPDFGKVSAGHGLTTRLYTEKEAGETTISIDVGRPSRRRPDNAETRFDNLIRGLADAMLNRRFEKLARSENPPFMSAESDYSDFLDFVEGSSLQIQTKPEQWEKALAAGEQELRRALQFGFTKAEFLEAKSNLLTGLENAAKQAGTRLSRNLADQLAQAVSQKRVFTHPADDLARVKLAIEKITPEACLERLRTDWKSEDIRIFAGGNLALEDGDAKIKEAYLNSRAVKVEPLKEEGAAEFAYTQFGEPGKIASREEAKDLGLTMVKFENNVRLNLKPTDFAKDAILVSVNFGAGQLTLPKDKPGLELFSSATFDAGSLEKHSADDLQRLLAGRTVGAGFTVADEFLNLSGKTNRADLALEFQLLCAQMTAPGYREEGVRQLKQGIDAIYTQVDRTPEGILKSRLESYLRSNDARFVFPKKEELSARTMAEVKAWLSGPLKDSFVEIAVVGDFEVEKAIEAAAATFGALPHRADRLPYAEERKVFRPAPEEKTFEFESKVPKAIVAVFWPTTDRRENIRLSRQLNLVAGILDDLVNEKVREELGESYSPDVHSSMSDTFTGEGAIAAFLIAEGKNAQDIGRIVKEIGAKLAVTGATQDQLDRARKPLLKMLEDQKRNNVWWLSTIVSQAQSAPQRLEWARTITGEYQKVSLEEVNKLAAEYLKPTRATIIRIVPKAPAKSNWTPKKPASDSAKKPAEAGAP